MIILAALTTAAVTVLTCPLVIRALERRAVLDHPGERSSHAVATPRGGGIAPAIGASIGALLAWPSTNGILLVVALTALAMGLLGLRDDLASLPAAVRLLVQVGIAAAVCVPLADGLATGPGAAVLAVGTAVWIVAFVNAFNFMDGINGISSAQAAVAGGAWALVGCWQDLPPVTAGGAVVLAAGLGFAPFNVPQARVFLGDVGSYFFGGWVASAAMAGLSHGLTVEMAAGPLAIYLADSGWTLVRRASRGESLTTPHREHAYQRLVISGWSHTRTTALAAVAMATCAVGGALTMTGQLAHRVVGVLVLAAAVSLYLVSPRLLSPTATATA